MHRQPSRRRFIAAGLAACVAASIPAPIWAAAPLQRQLRTPAGRAIELWTWPAQGRKRGTILFSHGAASSPRHYGLVLRHWAASGYDVLAPLHVDSTEHPRTADFVGLASWTARIEDMRMLSAQLGDAPYVAAGHSYGGLTAIAMGGGVSLIPDGIDGPLHDPKAAAVIALSPPTAFPTLVGPSGYAPTKVPLFLQTGTRDMTPNAADPKEWMGHLAAYDAALDDGHHYALVLQDVDHYFGGLICRPDADGPPTPAPLQHMLQLSGLFLSAYAPASRSARKGLHRHIGAQGWVGLHRK